MENPLQLGSLAPGEAVRRVALAELQRVREAGARALDATDAEGLHAFRVALRRLRTTLKLWKDELGASVRRRDRRALAELQEATGAGRDAEVALAWLAERRAQASPESRAAIEFLEAGLRERATQTARALAERLVHDLAAVAGELEPRLARYETQVDLLHRDAAPSFAAALAARVSAQARALVDALAAVEDPRAREAQHAARIEGKRLRYLVEPANGFAVPIAERARALGGELKRLQDVLGSANDAHVLGERIEASLAERERPPGAAIRAGLADLARALESERERLFRELEKTWLADRGARLHGLASALADSLAQPAITAHGAPDASGGSLEIERKFLLSGLPPLPAGAEVLEIEQGWLPGKLLRERLRRTTRPPGTAGPGGTTFHRALKLGRGLVRTEIEEQTTRELFEALWPLTSGCRVSKRRYRVAEGEFVWEIDEFTDRELVLAEVELPDRDARAEIPAWLAPFVVREVTEERGFTNLELAR